MKQLSNSLFKKFRLFIYQNLILILIALILIAVSCGEDRMEIPDPEPTTETVSKIYQSGRSNETWKGWKDGSAVITTTTNNDAKEAKLSKTITVNKSSTDKNTANKSATFSLDSVTAYDGNYLVFKDKNVSLTSNPQTVDISDKKVSYSHIIEWAGNSPDSWWKGWKNGKAYPDQKAEEATGVTARIMYKFFNDENTTTLDSLVGELSGYKTIVAKNITVKDYLAYKGGNSYGEFIFVRDNSGGESSTGDVAIRINHEGKDKSQSTITMTHTTLPQHTYGPFDTGDEIRHIFEDIYVDPDGSADYKVTVTSNLQDFLTTEAFVEIVEDVSGEKNGVKDVFVTDVPHEQTITWTIHDSKTKNTEEGVFIEVYKAFDDPQYGLILGEYITGATSDSQGKASVTIPDNTEIMTRTSRYDSYLKTVGTHFVQNVEFTYEMTDELNTTNLEIQFDESTGAQITAAQLNRYRPTPNFEWSNGHAHTYFEPGSEREGSIEHSKEIEKKIRQRRNNHCYRLQISRPNSINDRKL